MSSQEYYKESGEGQSRGHGGGPGAYGGGPGGGYYVPQQPQQAYAGGGGYGPPGGGPGYGGPGYGGPGGGYNQGGYYGPSGPQYGRPPQQGGTGSGSTNCCLALCAGLAACCCLNAFC